MNHNEKLSWMREWCDRNNAMLDLEGECGFGRECVGILVDNLYPDYEWYDEDFERIDDNVDIWTPADAYHKHPCVAVLGRGESAEAQLYDWLKWFDKRGFVVETGTKPYDVRLGSVLAIALGQDRYSRMVQKNGAEK